MAKTKNRAVKVPSSAKLPKATSSASDDSMRAISKAVADPSRFAVLRKIAHGGCATCGELLEGMDIKAATLSHHLKELESAGLIETAREGKFTRATLKRKVWKNYVSGLKDLLSA